MRTSQNPGQRNSLQEEEEEREEEARKEEKTFGKEEEEGEAQAAPASSCPFQGPASLQRPNLRAPAPLQGGAGGQLCREGGASLHTF